MVLLLLFLVVVNIRCLLSFPGAGVFVTTVVTGSVSIARPFELAQRPFLRDAIFYVGAAFWTFYILYTGEIWTAEAVGKAMWHQGNDQGAWRQSPLLPL